MQSFSLDKATEILENEGREAQFAYCIQYADGEKKDPDAIACLGQFYHNAKEPDRNLEKAEAYYRESALAGSEIGRTELFFLACHYMHFYPEGKTKLQFDEKMDFPLDLHKAEELLTLYERLGDTQMLWAVPRLFVWLGHYYDYGLCNIEENPEKAKEYYKYAADRQDKKGQFCYADLMAYGDCDCSDPESYKYYQLSANQGYVPAMLQLGRFVSHHRHRDWFPNLSGWTVAFLFGLLVMLPYGIMETIASECRTEIPQWVASGLQLTAKIGAIDIGYMAILLLMWGIATKKKLLLTVGILLAVMLPGLLTEVFPAAAHLLPGGLVWMSSFVGCLGFLGFSFGILHLCKVDSQEGYVWILKAAATGDPDGIYKKADALFYGNGVKKNRKEAIRCYEEAAEKGSTDAKIALGHLYRFGHHVPKDYIRSNQLFREAADTGDCDGQYMVGYCYEHGIGVAYDMKEARTWYHLGRENGSTLADKRLNKPLKPNILDYLMRRTPSYSQVENEKLRIELRFTQKERDDAKQALADEKENNKRLTEKIEKKIDQVEAAAERIEAGVEKANQSLEQLTAELMSTRQTLMEQFNRERLLVEKNIDHASEALIKMFSEYCRVAEATTAKKANEKKDYYALAKQRLEAKFGTAVWNRLQPDSRVSLISANTLYDLIKDEEQENDFDYSGICISVTAALENELSYYFLNEYTHSLDLKEFDQWPAATKVWDRKENKEVVKTRFVLGDLPHLLERDKKDRKDSGECSDYLKKYLRAIIKEKYFDPQNPNSCFTSKVLRDGTGLRFSFLKECDYIRDNYRNPAAHCTTVSKDKTEACCRKIIGAVEASEKLNATETVLMLLFELLKNPNEMPQ